MQLQAICSIASVFVVVFNVLTYFQLKRLFLIRLKLGVRPALVKEPCTSQQQQIFDANVMSRINNENRNISAAGDILVNQVNSQSVAIELHMFKSDELNRAQSDSTVQNQGVHEPALPKLTVPGSGIIGQLPTNNEPFQDPIPRLVKVADCGRKFKLTFLMSLRYLFLYLIMEVVVFVLDILNESDAALLSIYLIFINGFGDYVLYGIFNSRYRESHMEIHSRLLRSVFCIDLNAHPKLQRILSFLFVLS